MSQIKSDEDSDSAHHEQHLHNFSWPHRINLQPHFHWLPSSRPAICSSDNKATEKLVVQLGSGFLLSVECIIAIEEHRELPRCRLDSGDFVSPWYKFFNSPSPLLYFTYMSHGAWASGVNLILDSIRRR